MSFSVHLPAEVSFLPLATDKPRLLARTQARTNLASAYFQAGMPVFAMEELDQALNLMPRHAPALLLKALLYQQQRKADLAQTHFLMAFDSSPEEPQINLQWGIFDCQNGQFESAFEKIKRAFAFTMGPEQARVSWLWGQCLRRNDQFEAANVRMTEALMQLPSLISEALDLAELKIQLGKLSEAEKILENLNDSPSVSAQSVWLALQLAERQNQAVKKNHWGKMLGLHFSNSEQWRAYQEGAAHD
jgi:type IV pilus assembly protein PilF